VQFAESQKKQYLANLRTGIVTDTQDVTGSILSQSDAAVTEESLCKLLPEFTGKLSQIPPMYSAIKQDGKKLYELARKGIEVERKSRDITIYDLEYLGKSGDDFSLRIECSKGTYIRTLCHDLGEKLGCGAALSALRRTKSGDFSVDDAYTLSEIEERAGRGEAQELFLPIDSLFTQYPEYKLDEAQKSKCLCGNCFPAPIADGFYRVYDARGEFLMLGEVKASVMSTEKSFFEIK
jgi:tRNA pseudouridine55 synthase